MTRDHLRLVPPPKPAIEFEIFGVVKINGMLFITRDGRCDPAPTVSHVVDALFEFAEPAQATTLSWPLRAPKDGAA